MIQLEISVIPQSATTLISMGCNNQKSQLFVQGLIQHKTNDKEFDEKT